MMYQDMSSEKERRIRELMNQVHQLQARILDLQAQTELKDNQIHQLNYENLQLKVQLKRTIDELNQNQAVSQYTTATTNQYASQTITSNQYSHQATLSSKYNGQTPTYDTETSSNKRQCPICGAIGPDIKEYDDKTRIISYVPRRIYAKKRVCIKCRYEF